MPRTDEGYWYKTTPPQFRPLRDLMDQTVEDSISIDDYPGSREKYYRIVAIPAGYLYKLVPCSDNSEK